ncbi:hypothetical protein U2I53_03995 [Lysinibacillus capsici]|uniref:hypothetical protein n=1 Tax=Lysinibacillus capsici TaxID=2115968 RepID=UPI0032DFD1EC
MILLERQTSETQKMLEALVQRLPISNSKYTLYCEHLRRLQAGFAGEQFVDAKWLELDLPFPTIFFMTFKQ